MSEVLVIRTHKSNDILLAQHGTFSWRVGRKRAAKCRHVVICRLHKKRDPSSYREPQNAAVMVGEIAEVVPSKGEPGWSVMFGRVVVLPEPIPGVFPAQRNCVAYMDDAALRACGVDV